MVFTSAPSFTSSREKLLRVWHRSSNFDFKLFGLFGEELVSLLRGKKLSSLYITLLQFIQNGTLVASAYYSLEMESHSSTQPRVLILGHSFVRRMKQFLRQNHVEKDCRMDFNPLSQVVFFYPFPLRRGVVSTPLLNFAN